MASIELPPHVDEGRARLLLAIGLFQEEEVSVGRAAEIAGLSYRAFLDALLARGVPAFVYDDDEDGRREIESVQSAVRERSGEAA